MSEKKGRKGRNRRAAVGYGRSNRLRPPVDEHKPTSAQVAKLKKWGLLK
jgi:hypothetical protein